MWHSVISFILLLLVLLAGEGECEILRFVAIKMDQLFNIKKKK